MRSFSAGAISVLLCSLLICGKLIAGNAEHLQIGDLIEQGFQKLDDAALSALFHKRKITVSDIETGAAFLVQTSAGEYAKEGELNKIHDASPGKMFSPEVAGRAAILKNARYTIDGDSIIATDGIRQHRLNFYEKDGTVYVVRDVDSGRVYFQVKD